MFTIIAIVLMNRILFLILGPDQCLSMALPFLSAFPPAPYDYEDDVDEIERDKKACLPCSDLAILEDDKEYRYSDGEETNVAEKRASMDFEGFDDAHSTDDAGHDECCSTEQLSDGQAPGTSPHGGECGEDIGASVSKRQKGYASNILVKAQ